MFSKGDIYLANLNPRKGNEVGKLRPVVIYQSDILNEIKHPTTVIIPLSTQLIEDAYPLRLRIEKRENLKEASDVLCDQIRTIDNKRIKEKKVAELSLEEIYELDNRVKLVLGME